MKVTLLGALGLALSFTSHAADLDAIKAKINQQFPESHVQSVGQSQIPGWLEVVTENELVYANADASLLFIGRIVDASTKQDLTARRLNAIRSIDFGTLPLELAIKTVRGKGTRSIAVFADPLCPYCQGLEGELAKIDDVTIYTFLYPLESIHPGATQMAERVWCAADRGKAWTELMTKQVAPPARASCNAIALDTLQGFGKRMKIDTTPTLFLASGLRIGGFIEAAALEKELADAKPAPVAKR